MDSSTSHFKKRLPLRACALLLTAGLAWIVGVWYCLRGNPEVADYKYGVALKNAWADQMTRQYGAKTVIFGGSSCAFSVDAERMLRRYQLPVVNDGLHAGMGASVLAAAALRHVRPGDTLIIGLEPLVLTDQLTQPALGAQFSLACGHPEWALHPALGVGGVNWFQFANNLRPGGYLTFTMLGKFVLHLPAYRYKLSDYRPSGWTQTDDRRPISGPPEHGERLSPDGLLFLQRLRDWCQTNGVRAAYSLPWGYAPAPTMGQFRKQNVHFLLQIASIFPILKDPRLGADSDRSDFADTGFHLATAAAEERTDELASQILHWDVWTIPELEALEKSL